MPPEGPCSLPAGFVSSVACQTSELNVWYCRVLANVLFPNWLVTMMLLGLLIFLTYKTARKAFSLHRCEVRYLALREEHSAGQGGQARANEKARRGAEPADNVRLGEPLSCVRHPGCCDGPIRREYEIAFLADQYVLMKE